MQGDGFLPPSATEGGMMSAIPCRSEPRSPGAALAGRRWPAVAAALWLSACSVQPAREPLAVDGPARWAAAADRVAPAAAQVDWWRTLQDPAVDALVEAAERDAPTLDQAAARVAQARASLAGADATRQPHLDGSVQASRGSSLSSFPILIENQLSASLSPSWEIDLFGRLRHGQDAARARLDAQRADARLARLSLEATIADTVLLRRACALTLARQRDTVRSSETTLSLTAIKQQAGFAAPLEVARSRTSVGEARSALVGTEGQCRQYTQTLADLAGLDAPATEALLARPGPLETTPLPEVPALQPALPAVVLAQHPALLGAQRTADAAWEDIGAARAARLPSLNLSSLLSASWIQLGALQQSINTWSLGATLAGPIYDGGAGAANVAAARGRYDEAVAVLRQTLRDTVRDVELALIAGSSASDGVREAAATLVAAQDLFRASEAAQQAGRLSLFDLELARSALLSAQTSLIAAQRDRARAWVALIKATANPLPSPPPADGPAGAAP